ncbi:MAG: hypothetical protein PHR28_01870 [candidate division Zixibacteria bacterium]|nr:hypothetical protein [candidate division Zixibacteria bacterium]
MNKHVIYLDQFVISKMMKCIASGSGNPIDAKYGEYWIELYDRLMVLRNGQMIVCPYSDVHMDESILSGDHAKLKRMYEFLAFDVAFKSLHMIERMQMSNHANWWIEGLGDLHYEFDPQSVMSGAINTWQTWYYFSFPRNWLLNSREEKREYRERVHEKLKGLFRRWQNDQRSTFDDWFKAESAGYGKIILAEFARYYGKLKDISISGGLPSPFEIETPLIIDFVNDVLRVFESHGLSGKGLCSKVLDYFHSPSLQDIPNNRISSMMWAAVAQKAAHGQKRPLNKGMRDDIRFISVTLPYCDAMFIDKECHALLKESPPSKEIEKYGTKLFSLNNKQEFMEYLANILTTASAKHMAALSEVYGESWKIPHKPNFAE